MLKTGSVVMYSHLYMLNYVDNRKVFVTGHTGFKGSWLCAVLSMLGAKVIGYSLEESTTPGLFSVLGIGKGQFSNVKSYIGDVRDLEKLKKVFADEQPEIVIHMAAQPLVRESYQDPVGTYETNVMGTVNVLECCRMTPSVKSVVNVTTDKVYRNNEWDKGYIETDFLDGFDPYSNSKSCSELVTHSYIQSFFNNMDIRVSTCRAGNVIGGGDFAKDRIIPDCFRSVQNGVDIIVRNPYSTRPYQHVLEPLFTYLMVAMAQYEDASYASNYNVGPDDESCVTTGDLVTKFCNEWNKNSENPITWINKHDGGPHEANFLKLDCTKLKNTFEWEPVWNIDTAMEKLVEWYRIYISGGDVIECTNRQIKEYLECLKG